MTYISGRRHPESPLSEPLDLLLADVAIRIQLSASDYGKAEERYQSLGAWIDRADSPLAGRVQLTYTQGSMAIGATIASRLSTDEHDVDFVVQLDLPHHVSPGIVLDLLFESIRAERGSRYHDMVERRNRCVTVHYADKMHADITPMIRLINRPERESYLFHSKPESTKSEEWTLTANPFGFAMWFSENTPPDHEFAKLFETRTSEYERIVLEAKGETEDMPVQQPVHRKSKAVIVHQLMKRWRNVQYDKRDTRQPSSVMMAKLIADAANNTATLSEELLHQARSMRHFFEIHHGVGRLVQVPNPVCDADIFTDRWPAALNEQAVFIADLNELIAKLERLVAGCSLNEMRAIMVELFGESPTQETFNAFNERMGCSIRDGNSQHVLGTGRLSMGASGLVTGVAASSSTRSTPKSTFFGNEK